MKIKDGFMLREVGNQTVVVAVGEASKSFNGIIRLNPTGKFLWEKLGTQTDGNALLSAMLDEYDIDEETAKKDIAAFVSKLKGAGILE